MKSILLNILLDIEVVANDSSVKTMDNGNIDFYRRDGNETILNSDDSRKIDRLIFQRNSTKVSIVKYIIEYKAYRKYGNISGIETY